LREALEADQPGGREPDLVDGMPRNRERPAYTGGKIGVKSANQRLCRSAPSAFIRKMWAPCGHGRAAAARRKPTG